MRLDHCVQWWGRDNNPGRLSRRRQDTNSEWLLVEDHVRHIPDEAVRFDITCYCRQGSTGDAGLTMSSSVHPAVWSVDD